MGIEDYYLAKYTDAGNKGSLFLLKQLQRQDSSGGGEALLGSVVPVIKKSEEYPIPQSLLAPKILLTKLELERNRGNLPGLPAGSLTLKIDIAAETEAIKLSKDKMFKLGIGFFPLIPFNLGLDIDYSKMQSISLSYGNGTYYEYIPTGYFVQLFNLLRGEPTPDIGGNLLKKQGFISQMIFANNYSVTFESTEGFKTDFDAKLEAFNNLPSVNGAIRVTRQTIRTVRAEISSPIYYAIALAQLYWSDIAKLAT
jgi:hypothetical protein